MRNYSHSSLSAYQQCPYKFKLQYIDKVKVEIPTTIELFLGNLVHQALEMLYRELKTGKTPALQEVLEFYYTTWKKEYTPDILVVKQELTAEDYRDMGSQLLTVYYETHHPFDARQVIGLETQDLIRLDDRHNYHVRIDRLDRDEHGAYYVCDYKTSNSMKTQDEADEDRQLAMYSLWVKQHYPDAQSIQLVWYMLKHNSQVISSRSDEQLARLKQEVITLIREIEQAQEFPTRVSALCRWCVFQNICPEWSKNTGSRQTTLQ